MGRKKLVMKKIENSMARQITYSKRKDGIIRKANELSVLCDTDVGLLMFSPSGRLTSFASKGRVEDIFLRYIDRPGELRGGAVGNEEYLYRNLENLKYEGELLEKIAKMEALEQELCSLNQQKHAIQEKIRFYNPNVEKITSVHEAEVYQQYLVDAIQHIEELKAKLLGKQTAAQRPERLKAPAVDINDGDRTTEESVNSMRNRILSRDDHQHEDLSCPMGPHLSLSYLKNLSNWNLSGIGQSSNQNIN